MQKTDLKRYKQRGYASGEGRNAGILCAGAKSLSHAQRLLCTLDPLHSGQPCAPLPDQHAGQETTSHWLQGSVFQAALHSVRTLCGGADESNCRRHKITLPRVCWCCHLCQNLASVTGGQRQHRLCGGCCMLLSLRRAVQLLSPAQEQLKARQRTIACLQNSSTGKQTDKLRCLRIGQARQVLSARRKLLDSRSCLHWWNT